MIECFKQQSKIISNYNFALFIFHIYFYISQDTVLSLVTWKRMETKDDRTHMGTDVCTADQLPRMGLMRSV